MIFDFTIHAQFFAADIFATAGTATPLAVPAV
jgi:hypothetical protein